MMSDAHKTPETDSAGNRLGQISQHPERASDSVEQLRKELSDFMDTVDEETFDVERLDAILAAWDEVDPLPEGCIADPHESLAAFHRRHGTAQETNPVGPELHSSSKRFSGHLTFRKLLPTAAILVLLVCLLTPLASGQNFRQEFGRWTQWIFQMKDDTDDYAIIRNRPLSERESRTYETPQAMLDDFGLTARLVPTWVPERLGEPEVEASNSRQNICLYIDYENDDEFLSIYFSEITPANLRDIEKDYKDANTQKIEGIPHYVIVDEEKTKVIWESGELECHITGNLPYEEIEQVLYSIYEN